MDATDYEKATAIRIRLKSDFVVPKDYCLNASFTGKLINYNVEDMVAFDSFAFSGDVNNNPLRAEPLQLGVRAPVPFDRAEITKALNDRNEQPRQNSFDMKLIGKDNAGEIQYTKDITIVTDQKNGNVLVGNHNEFNIPVGLNYSIFEETPQDFLDPQYSIVPVINSDGTYTWKLGVANAPITHKVFYEPNGGVGSRVDRLFSLLY